MFWQEPCLSRLNMSVPSQAGDVWKHAERSEGMLSHIEAKSLAQTCCPTQPAAFPIPRPLHTQEVVVAKSSSVRRSSTTPDLFFLTCPSLAHSPPSGTGFSAYKAFPAPAATCPRLAASPSRGFYRPAARGRMQTFTAPRAPHARKIVRLAHICTRDLNAIVRETLTFS